MNTPTCDVVGGPLSTNSGTFSQSRWAKAETQVLVRLIPLISEPSGFDTGISTNGMSNKILSKLVLRARGSELFFLLKKCCSSSVVAIQIWQKFCQVLKDKTGRHEQIWRFWHYEIKVWIKDNKKLAPSSDISCPSCPPPPQHWQPLRNASRKSRDKLSFVRFVLGFKRELQNENFWSAGFCSIHFFGWLNSGEFALWVDSKFSKCISQPKRPTSPRLWRDLGFQIRIHWCHKHRDQGAHILWKNWS